MAFRIPANPKMNVRLAEFSSMLVILLILPKCSIPPFLVYDNGSLPDDSREEHEGGRKWKGSGKWGGNESIKQQ